MVRRGDGRGLLVGERGVGTWYPSPPPLAWDISSGESCGGGGGGAGGGGRVVVAGGAGLGHGADRRHEGLVAAV